MSALTLWQKMELRLNQLLFGVKEQQAFLEDIASLVEDGVSLKQTLEIILDINKKNAEQHIAKSMLQCLSEGKPVADGMQGYFPDHILALLRVGESGGILVQTLRSAAASLTQRENTFSMLLNIMAYPIVVACAAIIVSVFINHSIFASFRDITPIDQWPTGAQILASFAEFMQAWWWVVVLTLMVMIFLWARNMRDYVGDLRPTLDKLPIWSVYRKMHAARFMETLGLLIANGLVLKKALQVMQNRTSPYVASHLFIMEHRLGAGRDNIADVLDTGLIAPEDLSRLRIIAQSKGFEHALVRQGHRASEEGMQSIRTTGRVCSSALLAAAAGFAIFMVISVYSVGFSIAQG